MVVCKFFLQGNCRFGENCKFEHQLNDNRQQHASIIRQQNFPPSANNANIDTNTLIRAVANDMLTAEKGGQWLLSCYAPFKEKPNFPGFEEQSFEEVRWGYYETQRNGSVDQYNQQLQMALQSAAMKIRSLQNPSPDAVNTIKTIYNTTPTTATIFRNSNFNNAVNPFAQSNSYGNANIYGQNNQQQNPSAKSIFAVANQKMFNNGQQQSSSIFSNNQNAGGQNIFGNPQQNNTLSGSNAFNQAFANQNPFGIQPNPQISSQFGQQPFTQQLQTGGAMFSTQSPFVNQPNTSPFAQQQNGLPLMNAQQNASLPFNTQQPKTLPFGAGTNQQFAPPFGTPPNANLPFSSQQQIATSPFTAQQQGNMPFNLQSNTTPAPIAAPFGAPGNIFANTNSPQTLQHPSAMLANEARNVQDESVYSKLEDLNEADIKAYESENVEFGKIPEKPPTIQMCF